MSDYNDGLLPELALSILQFLQLPDLVAAACVCHGFRGPALQLIGQTEVSL